MILFIFLSSLFPINFNEWIEKKKDIISDYSYKVTFEYILSRKNIQSDWSGSNMITFYSINKDSSIIFFSDRAIVSNRGKDDIYIYDTAQRFIQDKDKELEKFKFIFTDIFIEDSFKLVKINNKKFIMSLNDYFLNMNINYNSIVDVMFFQNPYTVFINELEITEYDSIPYPQKAWADYEIFDFRE